MVKVKIHCPSCSKMGNIEIEENIIAESKRGISAVNVAEHLICPHSFVAYIDKNLNVRDYFITDFKIQLPEMDVEHKITEKEIPGKDEIDIYLITLNLSALWLTFIIRAGFLKKKILILNKFEILNDHIIKFFKFIFQDSFEIDIAIDIKEKYKINKKTYKDYIVIDGNNVIADNGKIMRQRTIKIERAIVQKFLAEDDPKISLIIIKNEIQKAYELSKSIVEYNNNLKDNEELTSKKILDYFSEDLGIKLSSQYLNFLFEIIENYFKVQLSISSDVVNFLGF
ncbi:MAG: hypothetical protein ACFFAN_21120 [Promethearchaeota archaeon]